MEQSQINDILKSVVPKQYLLPAQRDGVWHLTQEEINRFVDALLKSQIKSIPLESSPEANELIQDTLREYNFPANTQNAGRAGWRAARLYFES